MTHDVDCVQGAPHQPRSDQDPAGRDPLQLDPANVNPVVSPTTMAHAHLAAIVASSSEAIKSYSLDGFITSWNPAAERLFGYTSQEALGHRIDLIIPSDRRDEARRKLEVVRGGGSLRIETVRKRKDGGLIEVSINASPIRDPDGRVIGVSSLAHEIGERKKGHRALERYRLLSEHARDTLFIIRVRDGEILECNAAAVSSYGYSRAELVGMKIGDLRAPEARARLEEDLQGVVAGAHLFETTHLRRDGGSFAVEVSAAAHMVEGETLILSLVRDISERKEWARVQRLMTRELLHRVKNSVAVIQSLVRLTAPRTRSLEEFVASLSGRLSAMAAAHDLLTDMHWRGANLADLIAKQLAHYLEGPDPRVRVAGPAARLPQHHAVPMALALHELATNAAKHGSLSAPEGRVDLTWTISGARAKSLRLTWRETGGPPVGPPRSTGFGSTLIERGLPGAQVERKFLPEGLECTIVLDLSPPEKRQRRKA
ncbi:MAG: chemotaxis protein [Hyphomicrobiales bacterium]|nr:chemotaxis protein [Hyphomicrobiales bacterium]